MCDDVYADYGENPNYEKAEDEIGMENIDEYKGLNKGRVRM